MDESGELPLRKSNGGVLRISVPQHSVFPNTSCPRLSRLIPEVFNQNVQRRLGCAEIRFSKPTGGRFNVDGFLLDGNAQDAQHARCAQSLLPGKGSPIAVVHER